MLRRTALLVSFMLLGCFAHAFASDVPRMSTDELNSRLGESGLVIVDVRTGNDWNGSPTMVAGAIRGNPYEIDEWRPKLVKDQTIILYCS